MNASLSWFQVNLCLNPNSIRKSYPHLVFCIVGLKVDLEDHFPWIWVHDLAVLRSFTRTHLHTSKNGISAPHSTSSPHLAQTEQVRLTRFFALPDSNTSQRVTISVLGHVAVSQMGIVQVPYATVTVKYFRALNYQAGSAWMALSCMTRRMLCQDRQHDDELAHMGRS